MNTALKKIILLIALACIPFFPMTAVKRALVIGIGAYPETSGWAKINGDKDVQIVEEMLIANGFPKKNIAELKNEQATYAAICSEMDKIISTSQKGDIVYIHFSGHGQQITDTNGDEQDGLDEAWVAYDAAFAYQSGVYTGQHHIIDDQLNIWLHNLRNRVGASGKVIVVADACHSGDGTRGLSDDDEEPLVVRGTADTFIIPQGEKSNVSVTQYPIEWIYISACKPYQCNYEYQGKGSLTYALSQESKSFSSLTCAQLHQRLRSHIQQIVRQVQTPVMDVSGTLKEEIFLY